MKKKVVMEALASGEQLEMDILIQGKFPIGTIGIDARALMNALQVLLDSGEVRMFENDVIEEEAIEKLRSTPLDEDEISRFQAQRKAKQRGQIAMTEADESI